MKISRPIVTSLGVITALLLSPSSAQSQEQINQKEGVFCDTGTFVFGSTDAFGSQPGLSLTYAEFDLQNNTGNAIFSLVDCLNIGNDSMDLFAGVSHLQNLDNLPSQSQVSVGISPDTQNIWNGLKGGVIVSDFDSEQDVTLAADLSFENEADGIFDEFLIEARYTITNDAQTSLLGQVRFNLH